MLEIVPINFDKACEFIKEHHRHHRAPIGRVFQIAVKHDNKIVGVAIVGRPSSRHEDNGTTLEVTRLCTDGTKNACSKLYSTAWRIAKELGYKKLITYILYTETGISLIASGFNLIGETKGGSWSRQNRLRTDKHPLEKKLKYAKTIQWGCLSV